MLACGLSEALVEAFTSIAKSIPPMQKTVQGAMPWIWFVYANILSRVILDRLLDMISVILSGQGYKPLGAPPSLLRSESGGPVRDLTAPEVGDEVVVG